MIHPWASIGDPPEHRDWEPGMPTLEPEIGEGVRISAFCTVDAGIEEPTRIGKDTFLMARSHVAHDVQIGERCELGAGTVICGHVVIEDDVQIGGNTWVKPKVRIGKGARLGGGSVVVRDVPAGEVWAGSPGSTPNAERDDIGRSNREVV
jgi:acyl-[acyl carrier protein]--UDP-N-acetylglucosamine O-acyltransferase